MTVDFVVGIMAETVKVTLLVSAPVLIVGLVVGLIISLFQAVTQVQEMTLVFVPKIVACLVALVAALDDQSPAYFYGKNLHEHPHVHPLNLR
jgi:flagellar biosynthetic protein FliQ